MTATTAADAGRMTRTVHIPRTIEDVDAAWLTAAMSIDRPGLRVESAQVLQSLGGACTKLRVALQTNRPDVPETVIVKGCLEPHSQRMNHMQVREVDAYSRLVPQLRDVETVRCFFVGDDGAGRAALVMEDLNARGAVCLRAQEPIADRALAERFVDLIARLHAHWWDSPLLADDGPFAWCPGVLDPRLNAHGESRFTDPVIGPEILSSPRAAAVPRALHDVDRVLRGNEALKALRTSMPAVLAHGDTHLSNLFVTADGQPGFLDWTCRRAPWIFDLTYFIVGCLDIEDRRRWEKALVQRYLDQLAASGIAAPGFDTAWEAHRRWPLQGLMVWMPNTTDYHSEANITAMATRFAHAMIDHDTLGLLGV